MRLKWQGIGGEGKHSISICWGRGSSVQLLCVLQGNLELEEDHEEQALAPVHQGKETWENVVIYSSLRPEQRQQVERLHKEYSDIFIDVQCLVFT